MPTVCLVLLAVCPLLGSPPSLLEHPNEETVYAVLASEIPSLTINSLTLVSTGWANLVADVNNEWIFRFPRLNEHLVALQREQKLLEYLRNIIFLEIPHYQYFGVHTAFVGYPKIKGGVLSERIYLNLPIEIRQEVAESLALFFTELHHAVKLEDALQWGYREYHLPLQWIERDFLGTLSSIEIEEMVKEALNYAMQHPFKNTNPVLLHNDLHGENLAFDVNSQEVVGVFDFSDAAIGDYSVDFGKLFTIHQDLAFRTSEIYASVNEVENPVLPAAVDHILRRAMYILQARESGNTLRESFFMDMLQSFVPIWNLLKDKEG